MLSKLYSTIMVGKGVRQNHENAQNRRSNRYPSRLLLGGMPRSENTPTQAITERYSPLSAVKLSSKVKIDLGAAIPCPKLRWRAEKVSAAGFQLNHQKPVHHRGAA